MRRLGRRCWDTADGMDNEKEREEEGDDWFLGEAKGMHDLEVLGGKKRKKAINSQARKKKSLGGAAGFFYTFSFEKVRRGRYVHCILRPIGGWPPSVERVKKTGGPGKKEKRKKSGRLKH